MNDQERLREFVERISRMPGLDERTLQRLELELESRRVEQGDDEAGRLRVTVFDARPYDRESLDAANQGRFSLHYIKTALSTDTALAAAGSRAVCIFVNDRCDADVVEKLAALGVELIALRCSGYNHVDLQACARHGISVVRVPDYSPHAIAEFTVGLMLTLNRRLHHAYARNRSGNFVLDGLTGFDMYGKTAGVVGTGRIGQCTIDILLGFGCRVLAVDKHPQPKLAESGRVEYVSLERLFTESDIISLHVPLFAETHHLINHSAIETMKKGVMLINTSRGGLVDTRALIEGLKSGHIGAAGLDVYEEEAGIFFHDMSNKVLTDDVLARLMTFNNVVVTSHQAFLTREALANIADATLASMDEFCAGKRGSELSHGVSIA